MPSDCMLRPQPGTAPTAWKLQPSSTSSRSCTITRATLSKPSGLHKRGLQIRESQLGPDHLDVANSLDNLARLYQDQGRIDEAKALYERALAINERALGHDDPAATAARGRLARLVESRGRRPGLVPAAGSDEPVSAVPPAPVTAAAPAPARAAGDLAPAAAVTPATDARRTAAAAKASPKARAQKNADANWGETFFGR